MGSSLCRRPRACTDCACGLLAQDCLGNDLPVPLLKAHADELLAAPAMAHSSSSS